MTWRIPVNYVEYRNGRMIITSESLKKLNSEVPSFEKIQIATSRNIMHNIGELNMVDWDSCKEEIHNDFAYLDTVVEKMSKSKYNVVNPDDMIAQYGADTFRMYEMFLGPIELSKPWDTKGIEGVSRFLRKFWNLFFTEDKLTLSDAEPTNEELKILHQTIKKIDADIQKLAYNTCVSQFMICVNELQAMKCNKRSILEPLLVLLNPFAPFITEFLWKEIGNTNSVIDAPFPTHNEKYLIENSFTYPIAINGKTRVNMEFALDADALAIEKLVLENDQVQKFMEGKPMKKFIFVKGRMVNVVV
jgi:leucyl-tRNA synthetase